MVRLIAILVALFLATQANAQGTKISAYPSAAALTGVELFPCDQPAVGPTKKCTVAQVQQFINLQTYATGRYYMLEGTGSGAGIAVAANVITCMKGIVRQQLTFSVLTVNITTAGSSNVQSALYADTNGLPGALLSSTPSVADTSTLATAMTLSSNVQVGPGPVWFCTNQNDSTVVFTSNDRTKPGITGATIGAKVGAGGLASLVSTAASIVGISCSGANCNGGSSTFGTWPNLTGSTWTDVVTAAVPVLYFQPFSVP